MMEQYPRHSYQRDMVVAAGAALALTLSGCSYTGLQSDRQDCSVMAYLPDFTEGSDLARLTTSPDILQNLDQVTIAFALPTHNGDIRPPELSAEYIATINALPEDTELQLSVGGWSIDSDRPAMERNLRTLLSDPARFAGSLVAARDATAIALGRDPAALGFALDLEWPTVEEAASVTESVRLLRELVPEAIISIAIPPKSNRQGFDLPALARYVDQFDSMTYDYTVYDSSRPGTAGYIAPLDEVVAEIDNVVAEVGEAAMVLVGLPAYAYRYPGAVDIGQPYSQEADGFQSQIPINELDISIFYDDGLAQVEGAITSAVTPDMVSHRLAEIRDRHPEIGGSFVWSLPGADESFVEAMRGGCR